MVVIIIFLDRAAVNILNAITHSCTVQSHSCTVQSYTAAPCIHTQLHRAVTHSYVPAAGSPALVADLPALLATVVILQLATVAVAPGSEIKNIRKSTSNKTSIDK